MLAAVLKDFNNLVLEDVPMPVPGMREVVVRIKSCGFCATDYKAIKGIRRNVTFPFIPVATSRPAWWPRWGQGVKRHLQGRGRSDLPAVGLLRRRAQHCQASATRTTANTPSPPAAMGQRTTSGTGAFAQYMRTAEMSASWHKPAELSASTPPRLTEPLSGAWKGHDPV